MQTTGDFYLLVESMNIATVINLTSFIYNTDTIIAWLSQDLQ